MTTEVLGSGPTASLPEHTKLGPYRLLQELGQGGMGVVHLALDRSGRAVAIKVLRPHIAHDPTARARLAREVETLSRVDDPGVAPVLDADIEGDRPYLVTRYVPGPSLADVVESQGALDGGDLRRLGQGLADSLQAIHAAGVIHRDIKPGNVLLLDGEPVLIDFGIAHIADDVRLTSTGLVMGTPGYLSPELVEGAQVTEATDWWGWAATVAFGASGRPPFGKGPMDVVLARVCRGEADLSAVDPHLAPLLAAALTPRVEARPTVEEILWALDAFAAGRATTQVLTARSDRGLTAVMPQGLYAERPASSAPAAPAVAPRPAASVRPAGGVAVGAPAAAAALAPAVPPPALPPAQALVEAGPSAAVATGTPGGVATNTPAVDPRIDLAKRSGVLAALVALVTAGAAVAPIATALTVFVLTVIARTADRSVTSLVLRRHGNGIRRSDVPITVVSGPWHLLIALVSSVLAAVVPALVGVSAAFSTALAIGGLTAAPAQPGASIPCAVGGLFAVWIAWFGPAGASLRRGTRSLVRGVTRGDALRQSIVALLLLCAAGLAAWAYVRGGHPAWWPLADRPVRPSWLP